MTEVPRIDVHEARRKAQAGEALLVCAYDNAAKCRSIELDGSIGLDELRSRLSTLPPDQELVFYCA